MLARNTVEKAVNRQTQAKVDELFVTRWSPRAFDPEKPIAGDDIDSVFEAARWSPSSYNEQPWSFLVSTRDDDHFPEYLNLLTDTNQTWAAKAALIGYLVCKTHFSKTGKPNLCAELDCGSAWMAMTLQARKLGMYTHGMAGIHRDKVHSYFGIDGDKYKVLCGFALGYQGKPENLPDDLRVKEEPNSRKPLHYVVKRNVETFRD